MPQFTAESSRRAAQASHAETANRKPRPKKQAIELQHLLMKDARDPETTPAARAQIARAWRDLQEQVMELDGIGKPKPVPARNDKSAQVKTRKPVEPLGPSIE